MSNSNPWLSDKLSRPLSNTEVLGMTPGGYADYSQLHTRSVVAGDGAFPLRPAFVSLLQRAWRSKRQANGPYLARLYRYSPTTARLLQYTTSLPDKERQYATVTTALRFKLTVPNVIKHLDWGGALMDAWWQEDRAA